jgi:CelD/BcsL family acetyltransferase involved in cellulose biosynthesis
MISSAENAMSPAQAELSLPCRIARSVEDLDELAAVWDTFHEDTGQPMLSHAWTRACAAAFADAGQLEVTVVGAPAVAIAPLVRRDDTISRLELLGVDESGEPSDLLAASPSALAELAEALVRTGRPLHLKRVLAASPTVAALRRAYRGRGIVISMPHAAYPWIPLDATWTSPESRLNAGRRSDVRRARRIAAGLGQVEFRVLSPSPSELGPLLEDALRAEAASWKGRRGSALLNDAVTRTFFERYAVAAARQGILRLGFLRIGGRPAAMQLAVESGERFWLLKMGYDESFSRCSPGTLLIVETLRYAAERQLRSYEFLGTTEPWTLMWNPLMRYCVSVRAYPATAQGLAALMLDAGRIGSRKLARLMRGRPGSNGAHNHEQRAESDAEDMVVAAR